MGPECICRPLPMGSDHLPPWRTLQNRLPAMTLNPFSKRVGRSKETQFLHNMVGTELGVSPGSSRQNAFPQHELLAGG